MDQSEWLGTAGDTWAAEWRRTDRSFTVVTEKLLECTRGLKFTDVLDIGCGAGELSLAIARGRPDANVLGVDISPALITAAQDRAQNHSNVAFDNADIASWTAPQDFAPQLLISRHGVMFFDDPAAAFTNLAEQADAGANLLFSCFRAPAENPFFTDIARLLPAPSAPAPANAPGPFGFADRDHVAAVLGAGGWENISAEPFEFAMIAGTGPDPVEDAVAYFSKIGPAAGVLREMDDDSRRAFADQIRELARANCHGGVVSLPAAGWIVTARKA